jgi:uncharacterized protein with HEPN domain
MRTKRDARVCLDDILSAIRRIETYTAKGEEHFLSDSMTQDAVLRQMSIIGEAAAKLPLSLKRENGHIPWRKITGMRNILIHDYAETDIPVVWATIIEDLPDLKVAVGGMRAEHEAADQNRRKAA